MAPGVSAPVRSVLGVSAQPGVACPGVSPLKQSKLCDTEYNSLVQAKSNYTNEVLKNQDI